VKNKAKNPPEITHKLAFASTLSAGVALLLTIALLIVIEFFALRNALLEDSRIEVSILADNVSAALMFQDGAAANEILRSLNVSPDLVGIVLLDDQRVTLAKQPDGFTRQIPEVKRFAQTDYHFSLTRLEILSPVSYKNNQVGTLYLVKSLKTLFKRLGIYALAAIAAAIIALFVAVRLLARARQSVQLAEQNLHHLAHIDPVTGLANRHAFNERLGFAIEESQQFSEPLAMLLFDLDNFKQVNDTLGHQAGDELLRMLAQRIAKALRRDDTIARLGGDEFAVILKKITTSDEAGQICDKMVATLAKPFQIGSYDFFVTASIGAAFYPKDAGDGTTLIRNADTAMYQAKVSGKNTFRLFLPVMNAKIKQRHSLETSLHTALEKGELSLHYQPQFDFKHGSIVGFEGLLRWNSSIHGHVSPDNFIPIAEDTGLIVEIGDWVIKQALSDIQKWNQLRPVKLQVAVNLSARQLRDKDIAVRVAELLAEAAVPAEWLEIELTESMVMENVHAHIDTFQRLKIQGVKLAIDDFGTGYSSMSYLKRLPITSLKIDRSFVRDLATDKNDLAISAAIIALGHSLGLTVIAEGVETEDQANALFALGCDVGQGYLYSRPIPAEAVPQFLANYG